MGIIKTILTGNAFALMTFFSTNLCLFLMLGE